MREASRAYKNVGPDDCHATLIEITGRILPALDEDLALYARHRLEGNGVEIMLQRSVRTIFREGVETDDGRRIAGHTVIWAAGAAPNPLVRNLPLPLDKLGYILCERDQRVRGFQNVWAIGDCAVNLGPDGKPYPATAQHALREGNDLGRNIARVFQGRPTRPTDILTRGWMAALGGHKAVAKVFGFKVTGFPAWFIRQTYYLMRIPGWSRKLRIALDWTLNLFFTRDIVQLGARPGSDRPGSRRVA
jgi:NADH dehydrogenase